MQTTIEIDCELLKSAMKVLRVKSKKEVIEAGLKLILEQAAKQNITNMKGNVEFWSEYWEELYGANSLG